MTDAAKRSLANNDAFTSFYCEFSVTVGSIDKAEDEAEVQIGEVTGKANGVWAKSGAKECFVVTVGNVFKMTPVDDPDGRIIVSVPFSGAHAIVSSEDYALRLSVPTGSGTIEKRSPKHVSEFDPRCTLLVLGDVTPARSVLSHVEIPEPFSNALEENDETVTVTTDLGKFQNVVRFDKTKHYLATYCAVKSPKYSSDFRVLETLRIPDVGVFPKTIASIRGENGVWPKTAILWKLSKFELREPTPEELTHQLPQATQISRGLTSPFPRIELGPGEEINPDSLVRLYGKPDIEDETRE